MFHALEPRTTLSWLPVEQDEVSRQPIPPLFNQDHRGAPTLGTVAAVMVAFCIDSGVMWLSYREGASRPAGAPCEVVCRGP